MTPFYLLDTNILVHYIRDSILWRSVSSRYQPFLIDPKPIISVVTEGELRSLSLQRGWGPKKADRFEYALDYFDYETIDDRDIIRAYAVIDAHCESIGRPMGKNDLWIAATAAALNATLLTTDRDFDHLTPRFLARDWIDPVTP